MQCSQERVQLRQNVKENNREQEFLVTGIDREREQARRGLEKGGETVLNNAVNESESGLRERR